MLGVFQRPHKKVKLFMLVDKSLSIALLISTILHTAILLPPLRFGTPLVKKTPVLLKISYLPPKQASLKNPRIEEKSQPALEHNAQKKKTVTNFKANNSKPQNSPVKKIAGAAKTLAEVPKIEIPPELPKEKEALYLDYYQCIREKIRRVVVDNYPHYISCGEVCLYFVLSSNGTLKEIAIVKERSSQNRLLQEVAERSIYKAAPFTPFPKNLEQPQLSFNVIISFELEK